jgi:FkbM family methyltransferase
MQKKIYIEVGANRGTDTSRFVGADSIVYCFEPSMELAYELWTRYRANDNVIILPFAIDTDNKFQKFNIAGTADWGCSSLHEFNPRIHEEWPNRPDFIFTDSYIVPTISLYDFITLYNIPYVDYLWIDAQGHDFDVLKSLKDKIKIIKEGRCEASYNVKLYDNVDNTHTSIVDYLKNNNFETEIRVDASGFAECDVIFKNML